MTRIVLTILVSTLLIAETHGADTVTVHVLDKFDWDQDQQIEKVSTIKCSGIVRIWCWIRVSSDTRKVSPATYYIEYGYKDGNEREVLWDYNKEPETFIFERPVTEPEAIHCFVMRIICSKKGVHDFTVYVKKGGEMHAVGKSSVILEEE
jgi:hypothetical protein